MEKKIALLRGINVGGKKKILMKDLKLMFENMNFIDVSTYIQTGNVFFTTSSINHNNIYLSEFIENKIKTTFNYDVPVIVLDTRDIKEALSQNVFLQEKHEIEQLHLTFLKEIPADLNIDHLNNGIDRFKIIDKNVFVYCEGKYHQSKLTNTFFEKKLKVKATTRNWKTVLKLYELSK